MYGEDLDVVLFGENNHFDASTGYREAVLLDEISPEYVLLERPRTKDIPADVRERADTYTLEDVESDIVQEQGGLLLATAGTKKMDEAVSLYEDRYGMEERDLKCQILYNHINAALEEGEIQEVVGCDWEDLDALSYKIWAKYEFEAEEEQDREYNARKRKEADETRETVMADTIEKYTSEAQQPIVAILGKDHIGEDAALPEKLDDYDINYERLIV